MDDDEAEQLILQVLWESPHKPLKALDIQRRVGRKDCTKPTVNRVLHNRLNKVKAEITNSPDNPPLWRAIPTATHSASSPQPPPPAIPPTMQPHQPAVDPSLQPPPLGVVAPQPAPQPQLIGAVGGVATGQPASGDTVFLDGNRVYTLTPVRSSDIGRMTVGSGVQGSDGVAHPSSGRDLRVRDGEATGGVGACPVNRGVSPGQSRQFLDERCSYTLPSNPGDGKSLLNNLDTGGNNYDNTQSARKSGAAGVREQTSQLKAPDPNLATPMNKFTPEDDPKKTYTHSINNLTARVATNLTMDTKPSPSNLSTAQVTTPHNDPPAVTTPSPMASAAQGTRPPAKNSPTEPSTKKSTKKKSRLAVKFPSQSNSSSS